MSVARAFSIVARRAAVRPFSIAPRTFSTAASRFADAKGRYALQKGEKSGQLKSFDEIRTEEDLLPPGAEPGTIPTDLEQATGLERLEILGKMQGVDIFDMRPLPADRVGTMNEPIVVRSAGDEIQCGCTGCPADSHIVRWVVLSRTRPYERCDECGSVYKMDYVGPENDPHSHDSHGDHSDSHGPGDGGHGDHGHHPVFEEPKTMADYVKPEYWYR